MTRLRRLGAATAALTMAGAVLAGPASADTEGRTSRRSSSSSTVSASSSAAGTQTQASFNLGSLDAATRAKIMSALANSAALRKAKVSGNVNGNALQLGGNISPAALEMVKKILSSLGIDLTKLPVGGPVVGNVVGSVGSIAGAAGPGTEVRSSAGSTKSATEVKTSASAPKTSAGSSATSAVTGALSTVSGIIGPILALLRKILATLTGLLPG